MNKSLSKNSIVAFLLLVMMTVSMLFSSFAHAATDPLDNLKITVAKGLYTYYTGKKTYDFTETRYKQSGGGYFLYSDLVNTDAIKESSNDRSDFFVADKFDALTPSAKQDFLSDVFTIANAMAADTANGYYTGEDASIANAVTSDTVSDFMELIGQQSGMGSSMLATLMQNTKPDYAAANRIYEPFSGVVGTILGVVSVIIMALLGVTMALDLAYITIPAFQMAMGGDEGGQNGQGGKKGMSAIISQEAKKAVQAADGGGQGQSGDGSYKAAVGIYFKYRWKGLVILAICLLYLVQGEIYSFIGWFIDLFGGFLGM